MSLEALAPDQRAVVQLVLQQERSYDDLAGLLGISTEAVRERARAGLERVGGSPGDLTEEERAEISDYLLGQQSVSRREATRALLSSSPDGRRWANHVTDALATVARSPLPGVPDAGDDDDDGYDDEPLTPTVPEPAPETTAPALAIPDDDEDDEDETRVEVDDSTREQQATVTAPVRARPRPRPDADRTRPSGGSGRSAGKGDAPRASKLGGALLIAGIALILTVIVVVVLNGGGDDDPADEPAATATPTATATAAAQQQPQIAVELKGVNGSKARGAMGIYLTEPNQVTFQIQAIDVPASKEGEAYAVWLTGGPRPKRLGFAPTVGEDGQLGVSGPREGDAETFPQDFARAKKVVVSVETSQNATKPGRTIMSGDVPQGSP